MNRYFGSRGVTARQSRADSRTSLRRRCKFAAGRGKEFVRVTESTVTQFVNGKNNNNNQKQHKQEGKKNSRVNDLMDPEKRLPRLRVLMGELQIKMFLLDSSPSAAFGQSLIFNPIVGWTCSRGVSRL